MAGIRFRKSCHPILLAMAILHTNFIMETRITITRIRRHGMRIHTSNNNDIKGRRWKMG